MSRLTWLTILLIHDSIEHPVPASRGGHLEEEDHGLPERLEVVDLVQRSSQLHRHEETHPEDGEDEHDEEEEEADVEEGGHGHGEREQQRPNAPRALH